MGRIRYVPGQSTYSTEGLLNLASRSEQYQSFESWPQLFAEIGILNTRDLDKFYADHFAEKA